VVEELFRAQRHGCRLSLVGVSVSDYVTALVANQEQQFAVLTNVTTQQSRKYMVGQREEGTD
jgi:CelD/BcsL family acetyltransferase involved in cellulose biosynthesis